MPKSDESSWLMKTFWVSFRSGSVLVLNSCKHAGNIIIVKYNNLDLNGFLLKEKWSIIVNAHVIYNIKG